MARNVHFAVSPRLTALLGETYRNTEAALKELVDNAWDADAQNIWVTLPAETTSDPITIIDDGHGMTPDEIESEYLNIARDRVSRKGNKSPRFKRRIKGRKGIGKFAGLAAANNMQLETVREGKRSIIYIDKKEILDAPDDLERIPLLLNEEVTPDVEPGTKITLTNLDQALNYPKAEKLRGLLLYEYGREHSIKIYVNGRLLDVEDLPGESSNIKHKLAHAGEVRLRFTIADEKIPKQGGFVLRAGGKVVGKPQWFGLDEEEGIPDRLRRRIFGEIDVEGIDDVITNDWSAVNENSKVFQELKAVVNEEVSAALKLAYGRDMALHKGRLKQKFARRLEKLPEHRRQFAEVALGKVLIKFFEEHPDRVDTIATLVLDAMERDEYWYVFQQVDQARHGDVANFAEALELFGLVELTLMGERAHSRLQYLRDLEVLAANEETLEMQMHKAMERSLWVLGSPYHLMSSNQSLGTIINQYSEKKFSRRKATKRPDLLLNTDPVDRYLLIEFKRPSHSITRDDEAQAQTYADELADYLPSKSIDVMVIGGKRRSSAKSHNDAPNLTVRSYADIFSRARQEVQWIVDNATS
jgi:hypothetical protein